MEVDRRLRARPGEEVQGELRHRGEQRERGEQRQPEQRHEQAGEVAEIASARERRGDRARVGERRGRNPARRPADRVVAALEGRAAAGGEVRHDDCHGEERDDGPGKGDREPRAAAPRAQRVPEPHRGNDEPDLLLRQARERRDGRERDEPVGVEEPEAPEEKRRRERDRMEVVEDEPLRRGMQEVGEREAGAGPVRCRGASAEQVHGDRSGGDRDRLARPGAATDRARATRVARKRRRSGRSARRAARSAAPMSPVTDRKSPCAVDQTAWTRFPTSKRPVQNARCWSTASAPRPARERRQPAPTSRAGRVIAAPPPARAASASARRAPPPRPASSYVPRPAPARRLASASSPAIRRTASRERRGIAGRDEERRRCRRSGAPARPACPR